MKKFLICCEDEYLKLRFSKLLSENHYHYDITNQPIKKADLIDYSLIIIHSSYKLYQLQGFIENVIVAKQALIIYVSTNPFSSSFTHLKNQEYLILIDEYKLDTELVIAIRLFNKYQKIIDELRMTNAELNKNYLEKTNYFECKLILMEQGMKEVQAHQYILKYAMDNHLSKTEACKRLIEANKS